MDIVRFKGGLGNQMFQYALVEALRNRGREVKSSLGFYQKHPGAMPFLLNQVFKNVDLNVVDEAVFERIDNKWKEVKHKPDEAARCPGEKFFYVEENAHTYYEDVFRTKECTFVGYWQSEKYFKSIRDKIVDDFTFLTSDPDLGELGEKLMSDNYVSVHIRRGDYLKYDQGINVCPCSYYSESMAYMAKAIPNAKFIYFSDDIDWVKEAFSLEDAIVCEQSLFQHYEDWYDMYLMTKCKGNIIANSTFSWWGAWLNQNREQIVIAPKVWRQGKATPDIWCEKWIRI